MKIGLIVQGPLYSYGKKGSVLHKSNNLLSKDDFSDFNTIPLIEKKLDEIKINFDEVVLVTWKEDPLLTEFERKGLNIKTLLLSEKDYPSNKILGSYNILRRYNNKRKQYSTTLAGAKYLHEVGCNYIVKARTDLEINYTELKGIINSNLGLKGTLLPFPKQEEIDWAIGDFILGDEAVKFINWFEVMNTTIFAEGVHTDLLMGYLSISDPSHLLSKNLAYFFHEKFLRNSEAKSISPINEIINYHWESSFYFPGPDFWRQASLRGAQISNEYINLYEFDKKGIQLANINISNNYIKITSQLEFNFSQFNIIKFLRSIFGPAWLKYILKSLTSSFLDQLQLQLVTLKFKITHLSYRVLRIK